MSLFFSFFFFQAEDGIRDLYVTGVQTCALPILASWLGVAGMAGTCVPLARVFQSHVNQAADARQLAFALAAFAPGLVGYGLTANLSRVLYADGRNRASAV